MAAIRGCLEAHITVNYQHETSPKASRKKLEAKYLVKNVANRIYLKKNLYRFNMKKGATPTEHIDSFNKLLTELVNYDEVISDEEKATCLVNFLSEKYESIIKSLIHGKDKPTYDEIVTALRSEEFRKMDRDDISREDSGDTLLVRGRKPDRKKNVGQHRDKSRGHSKVKGNLAKDECVWCHEKGHWAKDCPKVKEWDKKSKSAANVVQSNKDVGGESDFSLVTVPSILWAKDDEWVLDSGATFHVTPNREWFSSFIKFEGEVLMGNHHSCSIVGIGNIRLKLHDGMIRELKNVRCVPSMKKNLISLGMLESKGLRLDCQNGVMKVISGAMVVMRGTRRYNLYYLNESTVFEDIATTEQSEVAAKESAMLWHMRLAHPGEKSLNTLIQKNMLKGAIASKLDFCEHCVKGKKTRSRFSKGMHKSSGILDYVHSDV